MIVSFEGPPAVGKSTTSRAIANCYQAFVVPEVNKLFARPKHEPEDWYLTRQVARWEMGIRQVNNFDWIVFDGDLFQPLWFSWIYYDEDWTNLEYCYKFYREQITKNRIAFPDVYFFFSTSSKERWHRELKRGTDAGRDEEKIRKKFERYERLVAPQKKYFQALHTQFPEKVRFLDSVTVEENLKLITSISQAESIYQNIDILEFSVAWLRKNKAEPFTAPTDCSATYC